MLFKDKEVTTRSTKNRDGLKWLSGERVWGGLGKELFFPL
jgi:hypothetical protein